MPYDVDLAQRIRELMTGEPDVTEMRMFGGLAFLVSGNVAVAASGQGGLMVRVEPGETDTLAAQPHVGPFEMRGQPMTRWLRVDVEGVGTLGELEEWGASGARLCAVAPGQAVTLIRSRKRGPQTPQRA